MNKTQQRLAQIKTSLDQNDFEMAQLQVTLLSDNPEVSNIIESLQSQAYQHALQLIERYLNETRTDLVEYQDTEIEALRTQLKDLEALIESLNEQKSEQLFLLNEFSTKRSIATGEILKQILQIQKDIEQDKLRQKQARYAEAKQDLKNEESNLKILKSKREALEEQLEALDELDFAYDEVEETLTSLNEEIREQQKQIKKEKKKVQQEKVIFEEAAQKAYEKAKQEYEQFDESYQEAKEDKVAQLNDEDVGLLKKLYRKAVKLCHPDTVADEFKDQAHEITQQLNNSRNNGDIKAVKLLLKQLEKGISLVVASDRLIDREQIECKIEQLVAKLEEINNEIEAINQNETWQLLASIGSWEAYFEEQKNELSVYLDHLQAQREQMFESKTSAIDNSNTSKVSNSPTSSTSQTEDYWDEEF